MCWKQIERNDIQRGMVIRQMNMNSCFDVSIITSVDSEIIKTARLMAYAHEDFNSDTPLLTVELQNWSWHSILIPGFFEVFKTKHLYVV